MPKYWPGTSTIVHEIEPTTVQGTLPSPSRYRPTPAEHERKSTRNAREYLDEAFRLAGGIEGLAKWAKEHPSEFYPAYIRARVPKPVEAVSEDSQVTIIIRPPTTPANQQAQTLSLDPPKQKPVAGTT
jgi:hypothetical protein